MKKNNIIKGVIALSVFALLGGGLVAANADTITTTANPVNGFVNRIKSGFHNNTPITAEQKAAFDAKRTANQATMTAKRTANQATMTAKRTAVQTAITNNDYATWVIAVGADNPIVQKINATNFSQYVQAHNLRQQADQIMISLGVNKGEGGNWGERGMSGNWGERGEGAPGRALGHYFGNGNGNGMNK